ncbi:unnamed protein product [Chironomus riparius]|uniref:GB1/RHD3-type G domain-containing protein n=1 Tax=Chironomus riparius TaxID=315576 RepID=A0A9N9S6D6_9DIPT|nr:unnamed protein product [Chironomus riparius]
MGHDHPHGKPENVLKFSQDNKVIVDEGPLKKMFEHPDVKNRKIVAFSIIGAYRKGKSFFLDYCLRFLYANFPSINYPNNPVESPDDWPGSEDEPLAGFSWRSGSTRDTTGIVMWNDIFLHTIETNGEKIAIVVMDTQGLFDNETSPMDNSRIFALGTLISSIQVLNLSGVVQEDQLQYLQFATEFAKFAADDSHGSSGKPFQNLIFLIRDWSNPDDHAFGTEGGESYLKYFLKVKSGQKEELKSVRQFIHSSFEEISCALLPHPGKSVAGGGRNIQQNKKYDGNWGAMDEDFKIELFNLIENLLKTERLVMKKINGKDLKGSEFLEYVQQYFKLFQSDKLPQAQSIYESTVEKQMNILIGLCIDNYKETVYKNQDLISNISQIPVFHNMSKNQALLIYKESKKMGNSDHETKFKKELSKQIDKLFSEWKNRSEANIKKIEEEKEKTLKALEEKQKLQLEQIENERKAAEKLRELESLKSAKAIEHEKYLKEKEIAKARLEAEQLRSQNAEFEKQKAEAFRKELEARLENERLRNELDKKSKRWCTVM